MLPSKDRECFSDWDSSGAVGDAELEAAAGAPSLEA